MEIGIISYEDWDYLIWRLRLSQMEIEIISYGDWDYLIIMNFLLFICVAFFKGHFSCRLR